MNEQTEKLVNAVFDHNTSEFNAICCIEEMTELSKVLTKRLRNSPKFNKENLLEEVSHVLLMCGVIAKEYELTETDILGKQIEAVDRMYNEIK